MQQDSTQIMMFVGKSRRAQAVWSLTPPQHKATPCHCSRFCTPTPNTKTHSSHHLLPSPETPTKHKHGYCDKHCYSHNTLTSGSLVAASSSARSATDGSWRAYTCQLARMTSSASSSCSAPRRTAAFGSPQRRCTRDMTGFRSWGEGIWEAGQHLRCLLWCRYCCNAEVRR